MPLLSARDLTYIALFAALTAIGALVSIPAGSVPFTLQVAVVVLAGFVLGPWLGAMSMVAYLLLGLVAPVYAGGASGVGALFGPLGGYLWGFAIAAWLTGWLRDRLRARRLVPMVLAGLAGLLPIYLVGTLWLAWSLHMSLGAAAAAGVAPFVLFDCVKVVAAGLTARALANLSPGLHALTRPR